MALIPEVVEKFQFDTDLFMEALKERVQELFPALAPEEQQNIPIMQSDTALATCLVRADSKICSDHPSAPYTQLGVIYKVDVSAKNGVASISDFQNLGRAADDGMSYTEEITQRLMNDIDEWFTPEHFFINPLQSGHCYFKFQTYNPNMMLSLRYGDPEVESTQQAPVRSIKRDGTYIDSNDNLCYVQLNAVEYSINAQGKVQTTMDSFYMMQTEYILHGLKGYPVVMNCDNDYYINKYITDNNADNNYTNIYTTPQGKTINLYYGDNYIITNVEDNEPVSYNDVKNALKIAVNQINEDNGTDITVPDFPIPPDPDDDDIEDQTIGAGANLGSIARLWLLTRQQLQDLHAAFANAPANYDPLTSFIGVLGFGVQPIKVVGDSLPWTLNPINIRMSNGELWHTGVEAHIVDSQVSAFSFPDIHIKKKYNNFLDYSPYATHEIFIPMCGWLTLPDIAVDRTISVTYLPDLESMKCRAIVSIVDEDGDRCVIGVKDGIMGAEVPFTNLNHSVWLANLITNAADVAGEIVTGAIGAGFTKTNAKGGTYRPYEGFTIGMAGTLPGAVGNALLSGNVNRTHVVGSNGNRTGFSDGDCIMIKSTYHKIDKPDNYDHTIGKVCNKTGQLSEFHGFTVCDNPHIHISALDEEKEEIKRLLEEGVILPDGE